MAEADMGEVAILEAVTAAAGAVIMVEATGEVIIAVLVLSLLVWD
jgi:hypothetical protein